MKTLDQILSYKSACLDGRDISRLARFMTVSQLKSIGITDEDFLKDHTPIEWTKKNILSSLESDIDFAFEKALNKRGISSSLMFNCIKMWMWVLDDEELQDYPDDSKHYAQYGLPLFKAVAVKYGFKNQIGNKVGNEYEFSSEDGWLRNDIIIRPKGWYKDPELKRAYQREWYAKNKHRVKSRVQDWYVKNKDSVVAYHKKYYQDNKERLRANAIKNKDRIRKTKKAWLAIPENYARVLAANRRYHNRKRQQNLQRKMSYDGKPPTRLILSRVKALKDRGYTLVDTALAMRKTISFIQKCWDQIK